MTVSGVDDVISFDECGIVLKTVMGIINVYGTEMRIINLNVDTKEIEISGKINGMIYQGTQSTRPPFFKRK
jgi:sporulation protein YabP